MMGIRTKSRAGTRAAIGIGAMIVALTGLLTGATTSYAATCAVSGTNLTFTLASGENATLRTAGRRVGISGVNCQGRPGADEVATIIVNGAGGNETLTIDDGASLAPGVGAEPGSIAEIEVTVDLGAGTDAVRLTGTAANDIYVAGTNGIDVNNDDDADVMYGNVERIGLDGDGGNDTLSAGGDPSTGTAVTLRTAIVGGAGNDTMRGGTRADIFLHEAGADVMYGGAGNDTASYAAAPARVVVSVGNRVGDGLVGEKDNVASDIEVVRGSAFGDRLTGHSGRNTLYGLGGNDVISGASGIDVLRGGPGADTLTGGLGADTLHGEAGADSFYSKDGIRDRLYGGAGVDRSRADRVDLRVGVERTF